MIVIKRLFRSIFQLVEKFISTIERKHKCLSTKMFLLSERRHATSRNTTFVEVLLSKTRRGQLLIVMNTYYLSTIVLVKTIALLPFLCPPSLCPPLPPQPKCIRSRRGVIIAYSASPTFHVR